MPRLKQVKHHFLILSIVHRKHWRRGHFGTQSTFMRHTFYLDIMCQIIQPVYNVNQGYFTIENIVSVYRATRNDN